jgi:hypothetical protein
VSALCYAIRYASGGYVGMRENGVTLHVEAPEHARHFAFMCSAMAAADRLGLALEDYEVAEVPEREVPFADLLPGPRRDLLQQYWRRV